MTWLFLYPLLRPLVRWAVLLALLVAADALLRSLLRFFITACIDPYLPRPVAGALALILIASAIFLFAALRVRRRRRRRRREQATHPTAPGGFAGRWEMVDEFGQPLSSMGAGCSGPYHVDPM
ncbi:MAG TPA: hypothetical protein VHR45_18580 [Thermoanaerobaculia bacterium]|nr:hypothetical protein [Thermoanaerobaculia bacterium]